MDKYNIRRRWFGLASLVMTMLIGFFWQASMTLHSDDFFYKHVSGPDMETWLWEGKGAEINSFSQVPEAVANHYMVVNGRGANAAYIAVQPLPHTLIRIFLGLVLAVQAWLLWKWSGPGSLSNSCIAILAPFLLWSAPEWNSMMQSADYEFNYSVGATLLIAVFILFIKNKDTKPGVWAWFLMCIFALWHECFSIYLGIFLGVLWLFDRRKTYLIAIGILIVGTLIQLSPGSTARAGRNLIQSGEHYLAIVPFVSKTWVAYVALVWWLLIRRELSDICRKDLDAFGYGLTAILVVAFCASNVIRMPLHAHWPVVIIAMLMCLKIAMLLKIRMKKRSGYTLLKIGLCVFYGLWGASLIYWQVRVSRFSSYVLEQVKSGTYIIPLGDESVNSIQHPIPFWLMGMTSYPYSQFENWHVASIGYMGSQGATLGYIVVNPEYAGKRLEEWPKVPGDNDFYFTASQNVVVCAHKSEGEEDFGTYLFTYGKPDIGHSPFRLLLGLLRQGSLTQQTATISESAPIFVATADCDTLDIPSFQFPPRTVQNRELIRIDRIRPIKN